MAGYGAARYDSPMARSSPTMRRRRLYHESAGERFEDGRHPAGPQVHPWHGLVVGGDHAALIQLQELAGNSAVTQLIQDRRRVPVQRCHPTHPDCGCEEPGDTTDQGDVSEVPTVSRLVDGPTVQRQPPAPPAPPGPTDQRQPAVDPWARVGGTTPAGTTVDPSGLAYRVVEDHVQTSATGDLQELLGLPPGSMPPGALENPDFLLSLLASSPGTSASSLEEITGVPESVAGALPEGKVVQVSDHDLMGMPPQEDTGRTITDVHGAARGANVATTQHLARVGYNAAGPNAIGIVAFPMSRVVRTGVAPGWKSIKTPGPWLPESWIMLGHTAVYVRVDGKIHLIRSYAPVSLPEAALKFKGVESGKVGVPAQIIDHLGHPQPAGGRMFDITSGQSMEYPVGKDAAIRFAKSLPEGGPLPGELYTARPEFASQLGPNTRLCNGRNCVHWAVGEVEKALGSPVGRGGQSVVDASGADSARQGKMQDLMTPSKTGPGPDPVKLPGGQTASPTLGRMPTHIKVFKYGGRIFAVVSLGFSAYRIANAPAGHEAEVFMEELGGHAGGIGGGAAGVATCVALVPGTAGLSLIACGIFGGLGGAKVGGAIGRQIGEGLDLLFRSPALIAQLLGDLSDLASAGISVARAPIDLMFQQLIERRAKLDVANWDIRYLPPTLQADMLTAGRALWSRLGGLDAQGLLNVARATVESLGVRGDVGGRLARGASELARQQGLPHLVITPEALLKQGPFEFVSTLESWNLSFVQEPGYISGSGGRYENEGALQFHLLPVLLTRAKINPGNWDVDKIPASYYDDGEPLDVPLDVERVGQITWSSLGKLDEEWFKERSQLTLPKLGVPDRLLEQIADGLTESHQIAAMTPETLQQLTPEGFVDYLISWHTGFDFKHSPDQVAQTSLRWVRAGFKPW